MKFWDILTYTDIFLFILVSLTVLYMAIFAFASQFSRHSSVPKAKKQNRFIILIPAHKAERNVERLTASILGQTYPQRLFDVTVISDHSSEMTNFRLAQQPITLLTPDFEKTTRTKLLQLAINNLPQFKIYDIVIILDPNNMVEPEFLEQMNDAYEAAGTRCIQAHLLSQNRDTVTSRLSAIFEEINNSIFRRGHITVGLSSATSGSGMAFDFNWFKQNISTAKTNWEDKELEALLLRQHIFVDYFDDILVYDEKTRHAEEFNRQRRNWIMTQLRSTLRTVRFLPIAILDRHYDLIDKIFQWLMLPRMVLMVIILLMGIIVPFIYLSMALKWWAMFAFVGFVFALATPNYLVDEKWNSTFFKIPLVLLVSILGRFGMGQRLKKIINK